MLRAWLILSSQPSVIECMAGKSCQWVPMGADPSMPLEDASEGDLKIKGKVGLRELLDILG